MKGGREMTQMNRMIRNYNRLAEMERFISYVRLNPECNRKEAILDIFGFKEQELETMLFFGMFNFNNHIDSLEEQLNKIKLLNYDNYIYDELNHLHKQYPSNKPIQYELFILDENDDFAKIKLNGVSAYTDWDGKVCFVVLPDENVRSTLKSVVTHEYHHHWRISGMAFRENEETVLDRLVLEGLAEHFVRIRLGEEYIGPYKDALSETQAKSLWESIYTVSYTHLTLPTKSLV